MRFSTPVALCLFLGSCSDPAQEAAPEECPDNQVSVSVSSGSVPTFTWAPACGIASLDVFPAAGGSSLWVLYSGQQADANPFRSGLRYGRAPAGAIQVTGPTPLVTGTEYTIIVYRFLSEGGALGALLAAGSTTFRP
jgi:hypothetical protein